MTRLILLIATAAAVYLLLKAYRKDDEPAQKQDVIEDMVRCAQCGVHLPKGESIQADGRFFCSAAHRDAFHG